MGPRRRRRRRYNRNVVELFLGIVAIVFVVLLLWLFGVTGLISMQARYKVYGLLRVLLRDRVRNTSDPVYLCDRLQVGFRDEPSRQVGE